MPGDAAPLAIEALSSSSPSHPNGRLSLRAPTAGEILKGTLK
jgi:hypothetical protein